MKSSAELQQPLDDAYLNVLSDAKFGDNNAIIGFRQPQPQWNIQGCPHVSGGAAVVRAANPLMMCSAVCSSGSMTHI